MHTHIINGVQMSKSVIGIILASGTGQRFGDSQPKQFMKLAGLPVIVHTLKAFQDSPLIDGVIVVSHEDYLDDVWEMVRLHALSKVEKVVAGGETRQESSRIGIECVGDEASCVLIHDSVRPFLPQSVITRLVKAVKIHDAVDTVIPSADTLVEIDGEGFIRRIPDRASFRRGQTPQAFKLKLIREAHAHASVEGIVNATDDCFLVLRTGTPVFTVEGDEQNIKITYPLDLHLADRLFQLKTHSMESVNNHVTLLSNKVFMIIGGTAGIGKSLCEKLRNHSRRVYCFSRSTALPVDICQIGTIQKAVDYVAGIEGRIDFAINCAGDLIRKNIEFTSLEEWQRIYDANINGSFYFAKSLIPLFRKQNSGSIMFIGSSSYTRGRGGYAAYSSSKAALVNFCQALSEELAPNNIKVNLVSPGRVRTPLRFRNFGNEDPATLLDADHVADEIVRALATDTTGSIFEVR